MLDLGFRMLGICCFVYNTCFLVPFSLKVC